MRTIEEVNADIAKAESKSSVDPTVAVRLRELRVEYAAILKAQTRARIKAAKDEQTQS